MSDRDDGRLAGKWEEPRAGRTAGRGGTAYEDGRRLAECADRGRRQVTHEDYWERITFFLEKIIHTAKGNDVRMASHPSNPPGRPFGYGYINALIQAVNSEA